MITILTATLSLALGVIIGHLMGYYQCKKKYETQFVVPKDHVIEDFLGVINTSHTQFVDAVSGKDKFNNANNVGDMLT